MAGMVEDASLGPRKGGHVPDRRDEVSAALDKNGIFVVERNNTRLGQEIEPFLYKGWGLDFQVVVLKTTTKFLVGPFAAEKTATVKSPETCGGLGRKLFTHLVDFLGRPVFSERQEVYTAGQVGEAPGEFGRCVSPHGPTGQIHPANVVLFQIVLEVYCDGEGVDGPIGQQVMQKASFKFRCQLEDASIESPAREKNQWGA
jgi:hypothetical protein